MSFIPFSAPPGWINVLLSEKHSRIAHILAEIAGLGIPGLLKPRKFRKFLTLITELAGEKDKEQDFMVAIEIMEQRHDFLRHANRLEHADQAFARHTDEIINHIWHKTHGHLDPETQEYH